MTKEKGFAVAIDGPVGVGKSTTAKLVAQQLGFTYIDTGAMYRAVAYYNVQKGNNITDSTVLENSISQINIELKYLNSIQRIYLNGSDISDKIRSQEISESTSIISTNIKVREAMVSQQQEMAKTAKIVMDGRDIGSVVLPWAQVKIYLDADPEIRAMRRLKELEEKGLNPKFETILEETKIRDNRDINRKESPLIQTADAIYIDTGKFTQEEVVTKIINYVQEELKCYTK